MARQHKHTNNRTGSALVDAGGERPAPVEQHTTATTTGHDRHGSEAVDLRPGWSRPLPEQIPRPTYWPAVLALGVTFVFWGVVTSAIISGIGLLVFALGLAGWIGELLHGDE